MSLVVGRIIGNKIRIDSDSKVTDKKAVLSDPLSSIIKTVLLHPCVSISYAGNTYYAEIALNSIFYSDIDSIEKLVNTLLQINKQSGFTTDFAVASIIDGSLFMSKISNGRCNNGLSSFWLGDKIAFNEYQKEYHGLIKSGRDIEECMSNAFMSVINNPNIQTVDYFHITLETDFKINPDYPVFLYRMKFENLTFSDVSENKNSSKVSLGSPEIGAYGVSYLVTVSPEFHGVAVYFTHGNFGVLFCPQINSIEGTIISNVSGLEFVKQIKKEFGIPLAGLISIDEFKVQLIDGRSL